jgi:hypothetical protein
MSKLNKIVFIYACEGGIYKQYLGRARSSSF